MTTATTHFSYSNTERSYIANVGCAVRNLLAALLAVKPAAACAESPAVVQRNRLDDLETLFTMANNYQHFSPNLASELRVMAARA